MLDELESFSWSSEQAVASEVALEAITEARAVCSAHIAALEDTVEPEDERLRAWEQALHRCAVQARELDPKDAAAVARVRPGYPAMVASWRAADD